MRRKQWCRLGKTPGEVLKKSVSNITGKTNAILSDVKEPGQQIQVGPFLWNAVPH